MHRFFAAFLSFLALYGTGEASNAIVIDAPIPDVRLRLSDFAEVVDGADVAFLDAYEQSRLLVTDGKVSFLTLHDNASAVINGGEISWIHLPDDLIRDIQNQAQQQPPDGPAQNLHELSIKAIQQALENARGNVSAAARQLGISRQTLYRKLQ